MVDKSLSELGCHLLSIKSASIDSNADAQKVSFPRIASSSEGAQGAKATKKNNLASIAKLATLEDRLEEIIEKNDEEDDDDGDEDNFDLAAPLNNVFSDLNDGDDYEHGEEEIKTFANTMNTGSASKLFANLKFFINREVPLQLIMEIYDPFHPRN